jgi:hypothetical protein
MRQAPGKHTIEVVFEAKWGPYGHLLCHEAVGDPSRPCWPYTEDGDPEPQEVGEKQGCMYAEWFDNADGLESLGGPDVRVVFALGDAEWDGDGFTFTLGPIKDSAAACADEHELAEANRGR